MNRINPLCTYSRMHQSTYKPRLGSEVLNDYFQTVKENFFKMVFFLPFICVLNLYYSNYILFF